VERAQVHGARSQRKRPVSLKTQLKKLGKVMLGVASSPVVFHGQSPAPPHPCSPDHADPSLDHRRWPKEKKRFHCNFASHVFQEPLSGLWQHAMQGMLGLVLFWKHHGLHG